MKTVFLQEQMIGQVRHLCHQDERIVAALLYGSFSKGEADEFSDIEFYVFIDDAQYDNFSPAEWLQEVSPLALYFINFFGLGIAIFENLVRGEFSFKKSSEMSSMRSVSPTIGPPDTDAMLVLDRTGELREHLDYLTSPRPRRDPHDDVRSLYYTFLNLLVSGVYNLARGERARSLDTLSIVQRHLLWLVRYHEGKTHESDLRAFRKLERDISPSAYARYVDCTGSLHDNSLERAYIASWVWSRQLIEDLAQRYEIDIPRKLIESIDSRLADLLHENEKL